MVSTHVRMPELPVPLETTAVTYSVLIYYYYSPVVYTATGDTVHINNRKAGQLVTVASGACIQHVKHCTVHI